MATVDLTRSKDRLFLIRGNYSESPTVQRVGKANPYSKTLTIRTGVYGRPGQGGQDKYKTESIENPYYQAPKDILNLAEERYAGFKKEFSDIAAATQADIAEQLKIIQGEKSSVSK